MKNYIKRISDDVISEKLSIIGAVLIEGPKWCGKSTTAEQLAKSIIYMQDPSKREQYEHLAKSDIRKFLEGETPLLIDEWQIIPFVWDGIRFEIDLRKANGQFLLTGSTTPVNDKEIYHTGTGRISRVKMRPMSLFESNDSNGSISLKKLFEEPKKVSDKVDKSIEDLAFVTCRGGWPRACEDNSEKSLLLAREYYNGLINTDISKVDNVERDPRKVDLLLKSYSRNISTGCTNETLRDDMSRFEDRTINTQTIASYLTALNRIFVIEELEAWNPNIRSKTIIRSSNTRHFVDPSIAVASLDLGPKDLINDLKFFGFLFEDMCIRDLRIYADLINAKIYHYLDKSGLECDAVIHRSNGDYALVEIKLYSDDGIEEGAKNLLKLKDKIDTEKMKEPKFMTVLTAQPVSYVREDGIFVISIFSLGP